MNYTLTQAIDRAKDLSGLLKAARAHEVDCAADHSAKLRIAEIAAEAHEKASAACVELEQEREALADHIAALVRKVGDPLELDTQVPLEPTGRPAMDFADAFYCEKHQAYHMDGEVPEGCARHPAFNSIFAEGADFHSQALADHIAALVRKVGDPLELQQGESAPDERRYGVLRMPNGEHIKVYDGENVTYEPSFGGRTLIDGVIRLPMTGLSEDEEVTVYGAYNSIFTEGADFHSQALQNGLDRIGEALDASRT